jgi:hypothetical protein
MALRFSRIVSGTWVSRSVPAKEALISTNETLIEVAQRVPLGVLCLSSALRFYELTTENPFEAWLAIERGAWSPKLGYPPVRLVHFSEAAFKFGIETHSVEGERCACIARRRPLRIASSSAPRLEWRPRIQALRSAYREKKATMDDLWRAAKVCRVVNVMRPYMESLI